MPIPPAIAVSAPTRSLVSATIGSPPTTKTISGTISEPCDILPCRFNGSFDLQFDVYPETGAYTLPHTMGYYNPPGADGSTFVGKMEEYFKPHSNLPMPQSPEIDFSSTATS